jgi:hypothetical protein
MKEVGVTGEKHRTLYKRSLQARKLLEEVTTMRNESQTPTHAFEIGRVVVQLKRQKPSQKADVTYV